MREYKVKMSNTIIAIIIVIVIVLAIWYYKSRSDHTLRWTQNFYMFDNVDISGAQFPQPYHAPVRVITIANGRNFIVPAENNAPYAWPEFGGKYLWVKPITDSKNVMIAMITEITDNIDSEPFLCAHIADGWRAPSLMAGAYASAGSRWIPRAIKCNLMRRKLFGCGATVRYSFMPSKWPEWVANSSEMRNLITPADGEYPTVTGTLFNVKYPELQFAPEITLSFRKYYFGLEMTSLDFTSQYILVPTSVSMVFRVFAINGGNEETIRQLIATNSLKYKEDPHIDDCDVARWKFKITQ